MADITVLMTVMMMLTWSELRERSVSPKRRHVPSSRGQRYAASSRMDAMEVAMLKYDDLEDANIIRAALSRLKGSVRV